jgi:hypothetical protein
MNVGVNQENALVSCHTCGAGKIQTMIGERNVSLLSSGLVVSFVFSPIFF